MICFLLILLMFDHEKNLYFQQLRYKGKVKTSEQAITTKLQTRKAVEYSTIPIRIYAYLYLVFHEESRGITAPDTKQHDSRDKNMSFARQANCRARQVSPLNIQSTTS
ncbi:hypothetical protein X801_10808 [Opisthorchis viverrini]|nr:hypothetical protein X801_10808 [Opisthorchis viverrini]